MEKLFAFAKVNLGLDIYQKQPHEIKHQLKSIFILDKTYYDEIYITPSNSLTITYFYNNEQLTIDNDIISRTISYLIEKHQIKKFNFEIKINKQIPFQSGLGGSSADGAAIMKYLMAKNNLDLNTLDLKDIVINLSSDLGFFLSGYKMALVSGYGEQIEQINKPIPNYVIEPNNCTSSTKDVYALFDKQIELNPASFKHNNYDQIIANLPHIEMLPINNLEQALFQANSTLIKHKTQNNLMTGSGSYFIKLK